ncbi:MAG: hypothetical protein L6300_06950 [Syntrophaceae bacterium]|nr:hypothetical protein [Actinomycetota bacterium]MCG2739963.1 hypothetical protein [Syntrophaceae bacterium]
MLDADARVFYNDVYDDNTIDSVDFLLKVKSNTIGLREAVLENLKDAEETIVRNKISLDKLNKSLGSLDHDINLILSQLYYYLAVDFVTHFPTWRPCRARKCVSAHHYLAMQRDNDK